MLQLSKLVLLCGLLTGTSASLPDNNVVRELQSALKKGLETDDSASEPIFEKVKADFESLQDFTCWEMITVKEVLNEKIQEIALDKHNTKNLQLLPRCLRLTIRSINIGNITFQGTSEGTSINLRIPITAKVILTLPLLGAIVDLTRNFVLQTSISFKIAENGTLMLVTGDCTYTPAKILLPVVNRPVSSLTGLISNIRRTLTTLVNEVEDYIVQFVLCPRIRTVITSSNENLVRNLNRKSQPGEAVGGSLCRLPRAGTLLYACLTGRPGQGTLEKFRILCPEQVRRVWLGERCPCRRRASVTLLP
uniref:Lipid-binding serum glycoprotein N-terminal domain-containing protein n=1 Tax=Moschus moschiferus TaxID=68415 RepID=A0A8C6DUU5_MOSMO